MSVGKAWLEPGQGKGQWTGPLDREKHSKLACEEHLPLMALPALRTGHQNLICWLGSRGCSSPIFLVVSNVVVVGGSNPGQSFQCQSVMPPAHNSVQNLLFPPPVAAALSSTVSEGFLKLY